MVIVCGDEELMGMYNGTNTLEISFALSYKHILTIRPCSSTVYLPKRNEKPSEKKKTRTITFT